MKRIWVAAIAILLLFAPCVALAEDAEVIVITFSPTPAPPTPTPPEVTPAPELVITTHENDAQSVDIAARSAYYSPFDVLYWKFVLWSVEYNRSICTKMVDGVPLYSRSFCEVATDKDEFTFWSNSLPHSTRGKEIMRLNRIAANLFFDYIKSAQETGAEPIVPYGGVILEFVQDKNGLNRTANIYDLNGKYLELMPRTEFDETIGAEYLTRLNGE